MTFGDAYLTHLNVLENIGMTSIEPIIYEAKKLCHFSSRGPFYQPSGLGETTKGKPALVTLSVDT